MNILDHYKQSHDLRTSQDYEVSINDQGAGLGTPAPVEGRFFYPGGDAPRPQYEGDMLERTGQALEDVGQTAKSMAVGAGAGMAGLPGDVVALTGGLARLLFPGDEGRIQSATDTITKISEAIGSERFLGLYRDLVNESDMSAEDKQMALDAAETGSFFSLPGAVPVAQAAKRGAKAFAAGAPARVAERQSGTTLASGVDPTAMIDDVIVSAGRKSQTFLSDIEQNVRAKFPDVDLDFYGDKDKGYTLSKIIVPKNSRKQGVGKAVMSELTQAADNEGAVIKLTPSKDFGATSTARLKKFYKQFGFVENKGRYKDFSIKETMYRLPVEKEINASIKPPTDDKPGIIAFHGSGADFDEFRLEMVGTGEGAQAYGYGLYFTDSEDIAKFYKEAMVARQEFMGGPIKYKGRKFAEFEDSAAAEAEPLKYKMIGELGKEIQRLSFSPELRQPAKAKQQLLASIDKQIEQQRAQYKREFPSVQETMEKAFTVPLLEQREALEKIDPADIELDLSEGKMYKVGLAPKPDELLDYDAPISQQSEKVQNALKVLSDDGYSDFESGEELMKFFRINFGLSPQEVSEYLYQGTDGAIKGIKYRAAGSRGATTTDEAAERNYVIFDDKAVKILEKYGIVGPVAVTAGAASQTDTEAADGKTT